MDERTVRAIQWYAARAYAGAISIAGKLAARRGRQLDEATVAEVRAALVEQLQLLNVRLGGEQRVPPD